MKTGFSAPVTEGQGEEFEKLIRETASRILKEVPFNKDSMQRLIEKGGQFQRNVIVLARKHSSPDDRFELVNSFKLTVPKSYDHGTQLATFASYAKNEKFCFYNEAITDENFAKATNKLVPGKAYAVKIFQIKTGVTSTDCLEFLASQKAILVGAQGLSLVRQLKQDEFPVGKWTVSFDKKDALWQDADGYRRVPFVNRYSDGHWRFGLGRFELAWPYDLCLVCFCDCA